MGCRTRRRTAFRSRSRPATSAGCRGSTSGPFRYQRRADRYLETALRYATVPVKQAVISPSALSLMYPADEIAGYPREQFITTCCASTRRRSARCLQKGAHNVQIDFTEGRLAVKIDPSGTAAAQLHRPEQSRAGAVLDRGAAAHRRAHLSRRRPRFDAQRRRRLRGAAAQPVRAEGGTISTSRWRVSRTAAAC